MPIINGSDPGISRQSTTPSVARTSPPTVSTSGSVTSNGTSIARGIVPIVSSSEVTYPLATEAVSANSVTITSSVNNDSGDVVTVYTSPSTISVSAVNQTINQYTSVDSGVNQIVAGNGVTITSTGNSGTGIVTINAASASFGNIAVLNLDGNSTNVLHGDGTWSADVADYGNSNVANYLPTYTGNITGDYMVLTHDANANVVYANYLYGDGSNITNVPASNPFNQDLNTTDNVQFANVTSTDAIRFSNSGNIVGALGYAPTFVSIESYGGNTVQITANDFHTWSFGNTGVLSKSDANGLVLAASYSAQIITDYGDNDRTWLFDGTSGELVLPGGNVLIDPTDDNFEVRGAQSINFEANAVVNIYTDTTTNGYQWQFGDDGRLTFPNNPENTDPVLRITGGSNPSIISETAAGDGPANLSISADFAIFSGYTGSTVKIYADDGEISGTNNIQIWANSGGATEYSWTFDNTGNLTVPGIISGASSYNQPSFITPNGADSNWSYGIYSDSGSNFWMQSRFYGQNQAERGFRVLEAEGNTVVFSVNGVGDATVAGNITADNIGNVAAVNLDGNVSNVLAGDGTWIAAGSGSSYGDSNVTTLLSAFGSNTITTTGNISGGTLLATSASGDEGGEITLVKAPNSTLTGNIVIDQYIDRIRFFDGGGTSRGAYIDLSQAGAGVSTLLNNRVSSIVNAGTFVTMDLLTVALTTSGSRGLSIASTTGSFTVNIGATYSTTLGGNDGDAAVVVVTTTPSTSLFSWNFTGQADTSTYVITDITNNRAYRVTLQIGASFNNNLISIERLV